MQVLAVVRRRTESYTDEQFAPLLEPEAQALRTLYAQGTVRSAWSREDRPGAVLLLEADSLDRARAVVQSFPLMERGMLELEQLVPLKGYRGFGPRG